MKPLSPSSNDSGSLLVLSNVPDQQTADKIAHALVQRGLAACVNQLAPCISTYRWQGKIEQAEEIPLLIKTTAARYAELEACIQALHPYELPEIIQVSISGGSAAYLNWLGQETSLQAFPPQDLSPQDNQA